MVKWLSCLAVAAGVLAACADPPSSPACTAHPYDTTSTSGDTVTTSTGLQFVVSAAGSGGAIDWCMGVMVHYDGYLLDGTKFDSSRDIDRPLIFTPGMGNLIDGFEQGVVGMRFQGKRRLIIPPELAWGSEPVRDGSGTIIVPANSTVVFDIEVLLIDP